MLYGIYEKVLNIHKVDNTKWVFLLKRLKFLYTEFEG